ncbi:siroheme synthase [Sistotremastrum suecicum HHB10207 ss-3]|uniref:precorrin-2 dehydrogenase n=1 Tax=Sistotremastrum suecicum HHB10207 ss-3 TaxID=1314776 RepID=A0A166GU25_9AGAM|nr:siroheme synthase [Sistotremastrum suecicum HHB10207 ss-3]
MTTPTKPVTSGSLLIAWQLRDKNVLIVGGGEVAAGRLEIVLGADARVTLIAPSEDLHKTIREIVDTNDRVTYHDRLFEGPEDLVGVDMALTAIDDVEESRRICEMARTRHIPINCADIPPSCDFYFGSQIRRGPLQILVSTDGNGPKIAHLIRRRIENVLPDDVEQTVLNVGRLRAKLRKRAPGVGGMLGKRRMGWMIKVSTQWSLEELAALDDLMMEKLLDEGWEKNAVPNDQAQALAASNA